MKFLKEHKIDTRQMIFPVNFAKQFNHLNGEYLNGNSDDISLSSLHLPSSTLLKEEQIEFICNKFLEGLSKFD